MNIPLNFKFNIISSSEKRLLILRKTPNESLNHIILKLLAYLSFFDDDLQIETDTSQHYKPDLVKFDKEQVWKAIKWIECGTIDPKKLLKISRHNRQAEICIFKSNKESALSLKNKLIKKTKHLSNICYFIFNKEQIDSIKQLLGDRNKIIILNKNFNADTGYLHLNFSNENLQFKFDLLG